ncbi:MAG: DUF4321 domain-containing protein [Clostridia bacterium]|nr:DUF4321 domain-containing protein [Clostridia bacterium]NLS85741.1 DUF4321 domain-containing protein [Oscillospiraceae bacterium]
MKLKRTFLLFFFILAGVITGSLLANVCANVPVLNWLAYGNSIGFNAVTVDLVVFKFTLGASMSITVAQIITLSLAIFIYNKTRI